LAGKAKNAAEKDLAATFVRDVHCGKRVVTTVAIE